VSQTLLDILNRDHILVNFSAADGFDALQQLTSLLVQTGHASPEYAQDAWDREETFPTGLPTLPYAVAIPHADPDHVNQTAICIGTLTKPIQFGQMGTDGSTLLDIKIIMLLAVKEKENQVEFIQQVVGLIQNQDFLEALMEQQDPSHVYQLVLLTLKKDSN
jgi:PTS system galactitol-specific IIA component